VIRVAALEPSLAGAWSELFEACASSCFCRYWHFEGNKNEWLARCAHEPTRNRDDQVTSIGVNEPSSRGLLALEGSIAVGWMKLTPRACLGKLTRLPVYKSLALGESDGVYVIGCLLMRPDRRRQGVARALVLAADAQVRAWGGSAIEAYPRQAEHPLHDEEAWMGPEKVYREAGYTWVAGEAPYPVYRKGLVQPPK
jgi:GNAT superfamily N-acetyltransferase